MRLDSLAGHRHDRDHRHRDPPHRLLRPHQPLPGGPGDSRLQGFRAHCCCNHWAAQLSRLDPSRLLNRLTYDKFAANERDLDN